MTRHTVRKHSPISTGKTTATQTKTGPTQSGSGGDTRAVVTATAPVELPGKAGLAEGPTVTIKDPPTMVPPSGASSKAETKAHLGAKSGHRKPRRSQRKDGSSQQGEGKVASSVTTIPPVSQKRSQSQRETPSQLSPNRATSTNTSLAPKPLVHKEPKIEDNPQPTSISDMTARQGQGGVLSPKNKRKGECKEFLLGRCTRGDQCQSLHIVHGPSECVQFKLGNCRDPQCRLQHAPLHEECRQFKRGQCRRGDRCHRIHPGVVHLQGDKRAKNNDSDTSFSSPDSTPPSTPPLQRRTLGTVQVTPVKSPNRSLTMGNNGSPVDESSPTRPATHDENGREVCRAYLGDRCKKGTRCPYSHPPRCDWIKYLTQTDDICEEYLEGRCFLGDNCWRRHPTQNIPPRATTTSSTDVLFAATKECHASAQAKGLVANGVQELQPPILQSRVNRIDPPVSADSSSASGQLLKGKIVVSENTPIGGPSQAGSSYKRSDKCPLERSRGKGASLPPVVEPPHRDKDVPSNGHEHNVERGTERLLGMLRQSADDWHARAQAFRQPAKSSSSSSAKGNVATASTTTRLVPDTPPGLTLEKASRASSSRSVAERPLTMSLRVLDSVEVVFGPGFEVEQVVTGFESRLLFLKNIPSHVSASRVREALSPFGEVANIHIPEKRPENGSMTVKATFVDHMAASAAARALDGAILFKARVTTRLASEGSTSLGKGVVRDGDVLLEFPAPCRDAFVGYSTLDGARQAIQIASSAQMGDMILSASLYTGLPAVGPYNVRFYGLPPDIQTGELDAFGPNVGVMFNRPNYPSLDDALRALQARLETYGELTVVTVISPPFENQTVRAWAHFTTPTAADYACKDLNGRHPRFFGLGRISAQHVLSITYKLPTRVFDVFYETLRDLRSRVHTTIHRCDITFHSRFKEQTGSVGVKLSAEGLPTLTKLKTSFEAVLRGEIVRFDGRAAWDSFFARASGAAFVAAQEMKHPNVIIQVDARKSCIRLFGSPRRTWRVRVAIQEQMVKLRSRKVHSIPLDSSLLGLFMNPDLLKLQRELGADNVYIDSRNMSLKIRGSQSALQVARLIVQNARRQHVVARKQPGQNTCPICLDNISLPVTLDCGHTWCKNCLTSYLLAAVETKSFPLQCLGGGAQCSYKVPLRIAHTLLSSEDFQRLAHASFVAYIQARPTEYHYCPTPDCPQVYRTAAPDTVLQCPSCLVRICGNCHIEYHEGKSCPDPEKEELRLFEEWSSGRDVKRCPGCKTFIERDAGCNHMTCTRCRTHICWVCLETFTEAAKCYDHMHLAHGGIGL